MIPVQYPEPHFKTKEEEGQRLIFCLIRKAWLVLTPEEWVRQNFLAYLINVLHYPSSLIAVEKELTLGDLKKRFDILVYNRDHQPWMLVECKEPSVNLSEVVLQQVLRYGISVPVNYLVITNGENTVGWRKEGSELVMVGEMPRFFSR